MARIALANGERVVATLRKPEVLSDFASKYTAEQLLVLRLDVSKPDEIKAAFAKAKATFGRIDVVFNNAGYAVAGEVEAIPDQPAQAMFDVNFWGAVHVSQEAVRFFREENSPQGGRLIQNSAGVGLVTLPTLGFYGSAKHGEHMWQFLIRMLYMEILMFPSAMCGVQRSRGSPKHCTRS